MYRLLSLLLTSAPKIIEHLINEASPYFSEFLPPLTSHLPLPMRHPRLLRRESVAIYHCVSRVVDKQFFFGEAEKNYFYQWLRRLETFTGVQVVTYCLMSNHFHLLVRVPHKESQEHLSERRLRELLPLLYHGRQLLEVRQELDRASAAAQSGSDSWLREMLTRYDRRRHDLSSFLKDLKQRFTQWFNGRHQRSGTLWEARFKSVLVQNGELALLTMAAYIDLNPVRAGICEDPKEYQWCGYAEAVGGRGEGRRLARKGLCAILRRTHFGTNRQITWAKVGPRYRVLLYVQGEERHPDRRSGSAMRYGPSRATVEAELARGGKLSIAEILRCRVRYFCDGDAFGSTEFVDQVYADNPIHFGKTRQSGARKMNGAEWGELRILRDLRKKVFG